MSNDAVSTTLPAPLDSDESSMPRNGFLKVRVFNFTLLLHLPPPNYPWKPCLLHQKK
jgi:hypothetical protein